MGSRSYDWLNYPTYNWFRQDLDKWDEENLTFSRRYFSFGSIIYNANSVLWFAAGMLWIMDASIMFRGTILFCWNNLPAMVYLQSFFLGLALTSHQNYR
jgi:hypothetical protein